jgi:ABC-type transporter MlaC component
MCFVHLSRRLGRTLTIAATVITATAIAPARAMDVEPSIARFVDEVAATARGANCAALLGWALDLPAVATAAAGAMRKRMSAAQASRFQALVGERLAADCHKRIGAYHGGAVEIVGVRANGDVRAVSVRASGESGVTTWRLRPGGPRGWRAIDMARDGRGLAASLREEYAAFLESHDDDIETLLAHMRR